MDRLTDVTPVTVERTVYVAESWMPSSSLCPGCGQKAMWFPVEATDTHICVACGGVYSFRSVAATDDHRTVIARIRQAVGWADGRAATPEQGREDEGDSPR